MKKNLGQVSSQVSCLFLDIGGVILTDGWNHHSRRRAATHFKLNYAEMEKYHQMNFDTYEEDKLTLSEYLDRVVFYKKRAFTRGQFQKFMFAESKPFPKMLQMVKSLKKQYGLKIFVVSNEGRELNAHRIRKFKLNEFVDAFISSCYVHTRKPDPGIYQIALDIAQVPTDQIIYLENTAQFVEMAEGFGIRSVLHDDYKSTLTKLAALGLPLNEVSRDDAKKIRTAPGAKADRDRKQIGGWQ